MVNIALVMTGNPLHKNRFIENLVKQNSKSIKVLIEINFKHPKQSRYKHIANYLNLLGFKGTLYTSGLLLRTRIMNTLDHVFTFQKSYSLKRIASKNKIKHHKVSTVNSKSFDDIMSRNNIDYIINSGNQIYSSKVLEKWKGRILNRHTSLLPEYGGIYPIFWQMLHGSSRGGVTLHWINEEIDSGEKAYQESFKFIPGHSMFHYYKLAFEISLRLTNQAIQDLEKGIVNKSKMLGSASYYSWPTKQDIRLFRKKGLKIV